LVLARIGLSAAHRISAGRASVFVRSSFVRVRSATTVLAIVLPGVASRSISAPIRNVILPIRVVHERVIIINVYIIVATPPAIATPSAAPGRSDCHPDAK
jgi:hypothetical protein